ncbi:MAG: hypothetical protein IT581_02545 [Verrucomicrobiales bacterium]|nr:hypothetical protein [Verrucomicrobiales bacterium]
MNTLTQFIANVLPLQAIATNLRRFFLAAVVLGSMAASHVASAAKIELAARIPGYGYVFLLPNSNTGGHILWNRDGFWYTDRISRGERLCAFVTTESGESNTNAKYGIWCKAKQRYLLGPRNLEWFGWGWYAEYVVSLDPWDDNLVFDVYTNLGLSTKRIPLGRR